MALYFLSSVCACLMSGYFLLKKNHGEIAHLFGIFGSICLIAILILAPWQILLLLLISAIISISYEYYTSKLNSTDTEYQQQTLSKFSSDYNLSYRGVSYCANSNSKSDKVTVPQVTYQLSYRGSTYSICSDSSAKMPRLSPPSVTDQLRFRGNPYSINKQDISEVEEITTTLHLNPKL